MSSKYKSGKYTWLPYDTDYNRIIPTLDDLGIHGFNEFRMAYFGERHYLKADHQDEWGVMIDSDIEYLGFNEPRDSGKTSTVALEVPIYEMVQDYNSAGLLVTASDYLSKQFNRALIDELKANKLLIRDFHTDWWLDQKKGREGYSSHEIHLKRTIVRREPSFTSAGIGKQLIGMHTDYRIIDDPIQTAEDRTGLRGEALQDWFSTVIFPMGGRMYVIGTRKAPEDIYWYLKRLHRFKWSTRAALSRIPEYETYIDKDDMLQIRITEKGLLKNPERKSKLVYWPEKYTLEELLLIRETIGHEAFSGEYQNEPIPRQGIVFPRKWLEYYDLPTFLQSKEFKFATLYTAVDPGGVSRDYTAIVTIAMVRGKIYILETKYGHWRVPDIFKQLKETYWQWHLYHKFPLKVSIETSFLQTSIYDFMDRASFGAMPLMEWKPTEKKELRIDSLATYFQRHLIHVSEQTNGFDEFIKEYLIYDPEKSRKHKIRNDVLDALHQVIYIATTSAQGMLGVSYDR